MSETDAGVGDDAFAEDSRIVRYANSIPVQFALGSLPFTGGLGAVVSGLAIQRQNERIESFLLSIAREIEYLQEDLVIDNDFIDTEAFAALAMTAIEEASRSVDDTRIEYLRQFVTNSARMERPDTNLLEVFLSYARRMTGAHVVLLIQFYETQKSINPRTGLEPSGLRVCLYVSESYPSMDIQSSCDASCSLTSSSLAY